MVRVYGTAVCDWCGVSDDDEPLIPIVLSINEGEEYGERWTKDACDDCFHKVSTALRSIGFIGGLLGNDEPGDPYDHLSVVEPKIEPDKDEQ